MSREPKHRKQTYILKFLKLPQRNLSIFGRLPCIRVAVISVNPEPKSCVLGQLLDLILCPYVLREEVERGSEPERRTPPSLFASLWTKCPHPPRPLSEIWKILRRERSWFVQITNDGKNPNGTNVARFLKDPVVSWKIYGTIYVYVVCPREIRVAAVHLCPEVRHKRKRFKTTLTFGIFFCVAAETAWFRGGPSPGRVHHHVWANFLSVSLSSLPAVCNSIQYPVTKENLYEFLDRCALGAQGQNRKRPSDPDTELMPPPAPKRPNRAAP